MRARLTLLAVLLPLSTAACTYDIAGVEVPPSHTYPGDDVTHPGEDMIYRQLPSGSFMMGCNDGQGRPCDTDEKPYHSVVLSSYEIDRTETSQFAYALCVNADVCTPPLAASLDPIDRGNYPVVGVTWNQARAFCQWAGRRLPTEAEWERAARGQDGRTWPWGNQEPTCDRVNFGDCGRTLRHLSEVDSSGASPDGVVDMAGNAMEWVADWYDDSAYDGAAGAVDPQGPQSGVVRVLRGGSFTSEARAVRTTYRGFAFPETSYEFVGFRCARSIDTTPGTD